MGLAVAEGLVRTATGRAWWSIPELTPPVRGRNHSTGLYIDERRRIDVDIRMRRQEDPAGVRFDGSPPGARGGAPIWGATSP
jgi:hypothetical protein